MSESEDMVKVLKSDGSPTELSPEEEKRVITELTWQAEGQVKEGDAFYLISRRWWQIWTAFANQNLRIRTNDGSSSEHQGSGSSSTLQRPSSIDNSDLICGLASDSLTPVIYNTLIEGTDYILVPEAVWNQFYAWYGGGPALPRKAISCGPSQTELTIEVYPLCLRLHVIPHGYWYAIRMSKKETIGALRRKACKIFHLNSDQVRIWDYFCGRKHGLLNELVKTLEDANIQMDQDILVEVFVRSGGCRGVIRENGPAGKGTLVLLEPSKRNHLITGGYFVNNGASSYCYLGWSQFQNLAFATRLSDKAPAPVGARTRGSYGGLIGLLNFGNTCFMNTAIQCLVHTPEFVRYFHGDFLQEINWHNPLGMMGELAIAFGDLLRKLWTPGPCAFVPRTFKAKLACFAPQFGGYNQHDCQELLAFLLDGLHEDLNRVKDKPYIKSTDADGRPDEQVADEYWANHIARNDSVIVDVCQGQYKSTLICPVCDKKSVTFDPFMYLSMPLQSTTRTMTVTVFSCDGNVLPTTCTVTVPKQGRCSDLIHALSSACSIKKNEKILLAEIQDNLIHRFLEDPLMSLSVIKDDDCLCAYKILKLMKNTLYIELVHRREEPEPGNPQATTTWKPYGTPLVFPVSTDATITRGDMQLIVHTMLSPMLKKVKSKTDISSVKKVKSETDISSVISNPLCDNNSSELDSTHKENSKSLLKLPLKLVDENNTPLDISVGEDKTICFSSSSMPVLLFIDWSPELLKIYETCYLEKLPKVFKDGYGTKKESLSLYTCIEAFLSEEPLLLEDMWFCSHCKERRQASKKLDLWRLPQVLVIHLKRFSYSWTVKNKLDTFVNFPLHDLDLTKYVANKNNSCPQVYELYALGNHYGSMGRGHYTADIKVQFINGKRWFNFDDSRVSAINEADVKSNAAYVLFYRRVNKTDYSSTRNRASNGVHNSADQKCYVRK